MMWLQRNSQLMWLYSILRFCHPTSNAQNEWPLNTVALLQALFTLGRDQVSWRGRLPIYSMQGKSLSQLLDRLPTQ